MNQKIKGIFLGVILIVVFGGIYLATHQTQKTSSIPPQRETKQVDTQKTETETEPVVSVTPNQETQQTDDITQDWQVYRNEEYGFEVKYPREINFSSGVAVPPKTAPEQRFDGPTLSFGGAKIVFSVWENVAHISFRDYFVKNDPDTVWIEESSNGMNSMYYDLRFLTEGPLGKEYDAENVFQSRDKKYFIRIGFSTTSEQEAVRSEEYLKFQKVISTFQFISGVTQETQQYIEVKELGFKLPVTSAQKENLNYKIEQPEGLESPIATFSSKELAEHCGDDGGPSIGKVVGTPIKNNTGGSEYYQSHLSDIKQFDGFFLMYGGPQASCTLGKRVDLEKKVADEVRASFENVILIK